MKEIIKGDNKGDNSRDDMKEDISLKFEVYECNKV